MVISRRSVTPLIARYIADIDFATATSSRVRTPAICSVSKTTGTPRKRGSDPGALNCSGEHASGRPAADRKRSHRVSIHSAIDGSGAKGRRRVAPGLAWFELIRTSHFFPSLFACRRISMPIESNDAEDNEEREGDFYSHAHTWSFLLVQPIVAWKVLANKRHLEPTLRFELRDPQFKDPQFTKLPLLLDSGVFRVRRRCAVNQLVFRRLLRNQPGRLSPCPTSWNR